MNKLFENRVQEIKYRVLREVAIQTWKGNDVFAEFNEVASNKFTELVYSGEWYTPLREALSAYFDKVNETVTGTVKLKLYKGNIIPAGSTSPYSLYNESMASFTTGELYNHKDADGFINLFGLPLKVRAMMMANHENK